MSLGAGGAHEHKANCARGLISAFEQYASIKPVSFLHKPTQTVPRRRLVNSATDGESGLHTCSFACANQIVTADNACLERLTLGKNA